MDNNQQNLKSKNYPKFNINRQPSISPANIQTNPNIDYNAYNSSSKGNPIFPNNSFKIKKEPTQIIDKNKYFLQNQTSLTYIIPYLEESNIEILYDKSKLKDDVLDMFKIVERNYNIREKSINEADKTEIYKVIFSFLDKNFEKQKSNNKIALNSSSECIII